MARTRSTHKLHVPLEEGLYKRLRAEADRTGRPATQLAREAIDSFLADLRHAAVHEAIASYASEAAGTKADLDSELEATGLDHLRDDEDA